MKSIASQIKPCSFHIEHASLSYGSSRKPERCLKVAIKRLSTISTGGRIKGKHKR